MFVFLLDTNKKLYKCLWYIITEESTLKIIYRALENTCT